jgi:hypothetical protein
VELRPIFPKPGQFPNDPSALPEKLFADRLYWGQDRIHFLKSAVERKTAAG